MQMIADEIREKEETIVEIMARLDLNDERTAERVESKEYQSIQKKTFREWAGAESEDKRVLIRNILANAAASSMTSDDVIRMFVDWVRTFSVLHFKVVGAIYNSAGITRRTIWEKIGKGPVREDSADADLFKLLVRDLSTGGIIRQHRETDYARPQSASFSENKVAKSAFDDGDAYELTELGEQFVHYAMTDLPPRIQYTSPPSAEAVKNTNPASMSVNGARDDNS
jgi:hypothetical protein